MRSVCIRQWWLPVLALFLAGLVPLPAAHAKPAETKTVVGKITGTPMGTWMTLSTGGTGAGSSFQVDLTNAKIREKTKSLKRYHLAEGMKVRVKGTMRMHVLSAASVEILSRAAPKK